MNSTLSKALIFVAGVAIGSAMTCHFVKNKYERIAQEEIDSVRAAFDQRIADLEERVDSSDEAPEVPAREDRGAKVRAEKRDYSAMLNNLGYTETEGEEVDDVPGPYVISPDDFDMLSDEGYKSKTLYLCADDVLIDENNTRIEDRDDMIGVGSLNHFGEYEDDSVFVRDDRRKIDYEILLEPRTYANVVHDGVK